MAVDRDPREGDEFQWVEGGLKWVVDGVTPRGALVYYTADGIGPFVTAVDGIGPHVTTVDHWREHATLVVPRPKVADSWGHLSGGLFSPASDEQTARYVVAMYPDKFTLARIVGGRVCDEHKVPFDFEAAT